MEVPVDDLGFTKSFTLEMKDEIKEFFEEYGFVVIKNIISEKELDKTAMEVWDLTEEYSNNLLSEYKESRTWKEWASDLITPPTSVSRSNPDSLSSFWPFSNHGMYPDIAKTKQMFENRQSENVFQAFSTVMETEELLVSIDRFGFMKHCDLPVWLHWDLNPWFATGVETPFYVLNTEQKVLKERALERWNRENSAKNILLIEHNNTCSLSPHPTQGLICISDSTEKNGGFMCIPGFHKKIESWAKSTPKFSDFTKVNVPENDILFNEENAVRLNIKRGSLLIWSSALPHCNFSGTAKDSRRICQYIKMIPSKIYDGDSVEDEEIRKARLSAIKHLFPKDFEVSPTGKRVFGFVE